MRIIIGLPLMTLALLFVIASAAASFEQAPQVSHEGPRRTLRVVASGRLIGTRELQQVVTWQTSGAAHLAIETLGSRPRVLWQMDGGNSESRVDSVRVADLDGDGLPEIVSLWWKGSSLGAVLRVVHWDRRQNSFVELQFESEINRVHSYRVVRVAGTRSSSRLVVETRSESSARRSTVPGVEYELRGSKLVRVGGGRVVTTQGESGIEGQAVISPAHPGPVREGMSDTAPYKTTLVVWSADGDREVTRFETGSDGRFRVALPPGTYRVGPPQRAGRFLPRGSEETVTVVPGKFVRVTINFDSGMR
jgi:hypothetical protein